MNRYEWKQQSRRLMESQEKFVKTIYMFLDLFEKFSDAQRAFREALDARDNWYEAGRNEARMQRELVDTLLESNTALQNAYKETHITVSENSERMERLLAKMEAYFGTTGLDYDN
jgi:hypothetical protein